MRSLTDQEKRTIRIAAIGLAIYLVAFAGFHAWKKLETVRAEYQQLQRTAQQLKRDLQPLENRMLLVQKLRQNSNVAFEKLSRSTVVAETSAAIQRAAQSGGVQLGPIRETPGSTAARELAAMQLEAIGPVPAILTLLHRLDTLGFPLAIDSVQINVEPARPGMVKLTLHLVIIDFEHWKQEPKRNA